MKLHAGQIQAIKEYVNGIPIEDGFFSFNGRGLQELENQILKAAPWRDFLKRIDLISLLLEITRRFQNEAEDRAKGFSGPIIGSPLASFVPSIEEELVRSLESIPRPYCICFYMPRFPRLGVSHTRLTRDASLIDTSAPDFPDELLEHPNQLASILAGATNKFERDSAYLEFFVPGYASYSLSSYSLGRAYARLKEVLFLGIRTGVIREKGWAIPQRGNGDTPTGRNALHAVVYNREDKSECYRISLPDDISKYLRWLQIDETKLITHVPGKTPLIGTTKAAETPEEKMRATRAIFHLAAEFADIDTSNSDSERIRAAIEWCFDADVSENETVAFLQRCIGLEAILGVRGDDQVRSITDRLSDRYSYLLGETASERLSLKEEFKKMYGKRSDVVHARRSVLSFADEAVSMEAKSMLNRVIIKEINGLLSSLRKQAKGKGGLP